MKNLFKVFSIITLVVAIGFSMAACDDGPNGPPGNYPTGGVPAAPTGLRATAASSTRIDLSWNAVSGAYGYKVYVSFYSSSGFQLEDTTYSTSYTINDATPGTIYYFRVTAYNANGESAMSSVASATTPAGTPTTPTTPTMPTNSLDGVWESLTDFRITVSGSTGYLNAHPTMGVFGGLVWKEAIDKGYIKLGDPVWRNLKSNGDNTWSGQILYLVLRSGYAELTGATEWLDTTFTLRADGKTLDVKAPTYLNEGTYGTFGRK